MTDLSKSLHCCRQGCLGRGIWTPLLVIRLVGQTVAEKPVKCIIPIRLCSKCKTEFEPMQALTWYGKAQLHALTAVQRGRRLNWDTLEVEWVASENAAQHIATEQIKKVDGS
jgi:hypothetical protein